MALKIRLQRHGSLHRPAYRIVVAESTARRDGRFVEKIGNYDPQARGQTPFCTLSLERATYWMGVGAKPTDTVRSLLAQKRREAS
ncbi:MAG: 30S ribosomal protein S16 [Puniceicoccales bacterium]|jgi:small subunit ribosomal protein S16|nr:30S ribosomal protein S16 [Puniceicoccales bacterium]